jgi:alcohol dehydrogenase YqhD (iron-dependent ADH family)
MTVFGGSLNKNGTNYLRKIHEADKVVKFLEEFKNVLEKEEKEIINESINILVDYITELGERGKINGEKD